MITIIGMHRSGTSALAGAMHSMGANLGDESTWLQPAADNPRGFFEFSPLVDLNRSILSAFGGSWSAPPALPPGWLEDNRLASFQERAESLVWQITDEMVVKDPRLSLLVPFWERATRVPASIHCIRHPAAVAQSLEARNHFTIDRGLFLWFRYTAAALLNRPDSLLVEYERLLAHPQSELRRIAQHIGLDATDAAIGAAAKTMSVSMAHHDPTCLPDTPIGTICGRLYNLMQSERELESDSLVSIWARLATDFPWGGPEDRDIARSRNEAAVLDRQLQGLTERHERLQKRAERINCELQYALQALDKAMITASVDLIRSHERASE